MIHIQSMAHVDESFFTSVGCMDGRVQKVIAEYGRKKFGVEYPDTITEAGIVGLLGKEKVDQNLLNLVEYKVVDVSVGKHHSKGIVVHGHAECAGNPVEYARHLDDIRLSVEVVKSLVTSVPVVGVYVLRNPKNKYEWIVEEVPLTVTA